MFDCEESPNGEVEKCVPDKFKLDLEDSIVLKNDGVRAYRIIALYSFNTPLGLVNVGDKGGYISEECNLCQHGSCWVWNNATVSGNAEIKDEAQVYENARIGDKLYLVMRGSMVMLLYAMNLIYLTVLKYVMMHKYVETHLYQTIL